MRTPVCRLCGRLDGLISEPTRAAAVAAAGRSGGRGRGGSVWYGMLGMHGDSGECDPYWSAENGQVATTQSADGCTCIVMHYLVRYI